MLNCVSFSDIVKYMLRKFHTANVSNCDLLRRLCDSYEDTSELISFDKLDCFLNSFEVWTVNDINCE